MELHTHICQSIIHKNCNNDVTFEIKTGGLIVTKKKRKKKGREREREKKEKKEGKSHREETSKRVTRRK